MQDAARNLTFRGGGVDHDTTADADAGMVHFTVRIALEEYQIAGTKIVHRRD